MNFFTLIRRALSPSPTVDKKSCWKVAGCSLPGAAHLRRGRTCEDASDWFLRDELLGIAVADGAGSAAHAALGSKLAVRTALDTLLDHHSNICPITATTATQILGLTYQMTLNALCKKADEIGVEWHALATTLITVVATRSFVAAAHIGDGSVVIKNAEGNLIALTSPTNGEFANQTVLLGCMQTTDVHISSLQDFHLQSITVFSDGIQRLALQMPQCEPHEPFFLPLFERLQCLTESEMENFIKDFLNSPRVNARTNDDKTLVTACLQ